MYNPLHKEWYYTMKELLLNVLAFVVTAGIIGILAHILGEKLPRAKFDPGKFPYAPYAWEKDGKVYEKLGIAKWKDKMPDKSKFTFAQNKTVRKSVGRDASGAHFELLARETCVAEAVHWALLVISPVLLITMTGWLSIVATVLYGLSNVPFIMIQRYNRPRLVRLYKRMNARQGGQNK